MIAATGSTLANTSMPDGPGDTGPQIALGVGQVFVEYKSAPAVAKQPWSLSSSQPSQYLPAEIACGDDSGNLSHPSRPASTITAGVAARSSAGSPEVVELYSRPIAPPPWLVAFTRTWIASTCQGSLALFGGGPSVAADASLNPADPRVFQTEGCMRLGNTVAT